jgi:hypothetical protein
MSNTATMCTCIEDLYRAEIRVPLGPTVLMGVGALLVYRLWKFVTAVFNEDDDESVMTDDTAWESESEDEETVSEDTDAEDTDSEGMDAEDTIDNSRMDPEGVPYDPSAENPDSDAVATATTSFWHSKVQNELFAPAADPDIFSEDDPAEYEVSLTEPEVSLTEPEVSLTEPEVSLIDAPIPGPTLTVPAVLAVISSTEEASSDTVPPSPEIDGTPSESSPPDAV